MVEWIGFWGGGVEVVGWGIELLKLICWPVSVSDRIVESGWAWAVRGLMVWKSASWPVGKSASWSAGISDKPP